MSHLGWTLADYPPGARIGTSSPRRAAQIAELRPDLAIVPIRGNVDTRLRKAAGDECDGAILAAAGLHRLGMADVIAEYLSPQEFVPPPGQGAMAVEIRANDARTRDLVAPANHHATAVATAAERAFLRTLGGGCQVPVGAYAAPAGDDRLDLTVFMAAPDGSAACRATVSGAANDATGLAAAAWAQLQAQGAADLII